MKKVCTNIVIQCAPAPTLLYRFPNIEERLINGFTFLDNQHMMPPWYICERRRERYFWTRLRQFCLPYFWTKLVQFLPFGTDLVYLMEFLLITIPDTGVSSSPVSRSSKRFFFKIFGFAGWDVLGWFLWDGIFPARQNKKGTYPVNDLSKCLSKPFKSCSSWLITCIKLAVVHGYATFHDAPRTIILLLHCLPCESVRFFRFRTETGQSVLIRDCPSCHGLGRHGTKSHIIPDSSSSGKSLLILPYRVLACHTRSF